MVTWTEAFKAATKIVLLATGFYILGSIIVIFGAISAFSSVWSGRYNTSVIVGSFLTYLVGMVIIALGGVAAVLKIQTDLLVREVRKSLVVPQARLEQSAGIQCVKCGTMNSLESQFCINCGQELTT